MIRSAFVEAELRMIPDAVNIGPRTVVAIIPSDIDPLADEMRVEASGVMISRAYDPVMVQP